MCRLQTAAARILLGLVFFGIVILKLIAITSTPDGYVQYQFMLGQLGLPAVFAPLLILVQFVFGLALLVGFKTKIAARVLGVLAAFMAIVLSQASLDAFFAYMGIAGGMWMLSLYPQTGFSLDNRSK
jgi:putative oxidoreductase